MEADWEIDIGPDSPLIDVAWQGYVDLPQDSTRIHEITESAACPALAAALLLINAPALLSERLAGDQAIPLKSVKCDLWTTGACDPYEMEATPATSLCGTACYIDLVPRCTGLFTSLSAAEFWVRLTTESLHRQPLAASRIDLVVRQTVTSSLYGLGVSAYISACGATEQDARSTLDRALNIFAETITAPQNPPAPASDRQTGTVTMKPAGE